MVNEFTVEELKEVIKAARIFNPGFGEEQFQSLVELEARLSDSGYLKTVSGLLKLEKEKDIPLGQALEMYDRLLRDNEALNKEVTARNTELEALEGRLKVTKGKYQEVTKAIQDASIQLEKLRRAKEREENELASFEKEVAKEKKRIDEEMNEYYHQADVTQAEIDAAGQLKAEVAKHGFTLDLVLGIAAEFASYTNARERLAEALKKRGKLTSHLSALEAEIKTLNENKRTIGDMLYRLKTEQAQRETFLSQLQAEIAEKGELVGFYHRYIHLRSLMEYLGTSTYLTFHHCMWCGALFWVLRPGSIATSSYKCPWCSLTIVEADKNAYAAVDQPPGTLLKLLP